jgi:SAM-dependent methyltransferase
MLILDATIGSKKIYHSFDKNITEELIGIDIRKGDFSYKYPSQWTEIKVVILPTIQCDMKFLPFRDSIFDLIIFDPPHCSPSNSGTCKLYGGWTEHERITTSRAVNLEFDRVLKNNGFLILKCLEKQFRLYETLLKNFKFFLPIYTEARRGAWKPTGKGAIWAIGCKKKS